MGGPLTGRLILIAEDEPLIALDVKQTFEEEGAKVIVARTLDDALRGVEHPALSAAVLDYALGDGDSSGICERMKERKIPFIVYTGYDNLWCISRSRRAFRTWWQPSEV